MVSNMGGFKMKITIPQTSAGQLDTAIGKTHSISSLERMELFKWARLGEGYNRNHQRM